MYDYKEGKKRILNILTSKTKIEKRDKVPANEDEFTYENGIKTRVGALFVDIRNSTDYFKNNKSEIVSRVMRAFCSEIITILNTDNNYRQIGIRGDCIYGIFTAPESDDLNRIFSHAVLINTFQKMFQKILKNNGMPSFEIGIGLGCSEDLVIKAGKKGTGINDYIWIGDAVIDASKLSSQGNINSFNPIVMDNNFYENIKDFDANKNEKYSSLIKKKFSNKLYEYVWHCNIIRIEFNNWIDEGML